MKMDGSSVWPQFMMAFLCNVATMTYGLQLGWLSPLQPRFQSTDSPLGRDTAPLTDEEISWIGALPSVTLVLSAPIFGYTMNRYGRKFSLLLTNAPNIVTYLLLIFAPGPHLVYVSRVIGGFCSCGAFIVGPIYINEAVEGKLKGTLSGLTGFFVKLGIIVSYTLGAYTSYLALNLISMSFTVVFLILFFWIPESPVYLIMQDKRLEAKAALKRLRGRQTENLEEELKSIELLIVKNEVKESVFSELKQFCMKRPLRRAAIIVMGIFSFQMLSGYPAVVRYNVDIFDNCNITLSPYVAAILLAVSQLLFSLLGACVLEKSGRKLLVIIGLALMGFCMGSLSVYLGFDYYYPGHWLLNEIRFLPVVALLVFIASYALAFGCVPFVIIPELFSPKDRAMASTLLNLWFAVVELVVAKLFLTIANIVNMWGAFLIFAILNFLGVLFICIVMFETKGLEFSDIYIKLGGKPITRTASSEFSNEVEDLLTKEKEKNFKNYCETKEPLN